MKAMKTVKITLALGLSALALSACSSETDTTADDTVVTDETPMAADDTAMTADTAAAGTQTIVAMAQGNAELSTLVSADAIMVMHRGGIVDAGRHEELLKRCEIYAHLWRQQTQHL